MKSYTLPPKDHYKSKVKYIPQNLPSHRYVPTQRSPTAPTATAANSPAPEPILTLPTAALDDVLAGAALVDEAALLPDADVDAALAEDAEPEAAVLRVLMTLAVLNWLAELELGGAAVVLGAAELLVGAGAEVVGAAVELGAGLELARTLLRILNCGVKLMVLESCSSMISSV